MKNVVGYVRVSSEEQIKGFSLKSQKDKIYDYANLKNWKVFKIYMDEGISGTSIKKRKSFQEMIKESKLGKFSAVLVTKFDRAFRNVVDALNTIDELHKSNIDFVSITEDIDTTSPMGRAIFTVISVFAELESKKNSERVRDVRLNQFEKGIIPGRTHFGYKPVFKDKKNKRGILKIIPHPKQSKIVQDIFLMASQKKPYSEICRKHKINPQTFYNIIRNKVYIGIISFEGVEKIGSHEHLVSEELFRKVNSS